VAFDFLAILSEGRLKGKSAVRYNEYLDSLRQKDDLFMLEIEREKEPYQSPKNFIFPSLIVPLESKLQ